MVRWLLQHGADINIKGLLASSRSWYSEASDDMVLKLLLDKYVAVNVYGKLPRYALHKVAGRGFLGVVKLFLDNGMGVNILNEDKMTALQCATSNGHAAVAQLLLDYGASDAQKLWIACKWGQESVVRQLFDNGINPNVGDALLDTSCEGHESVVRLLLDNGTDINAFEASKQTAFVAASSRGHGSIVRLLLDRGTYINTLGEGDQTALIAASSEGMNPLFDYSSIKALKSMLGTRGTRLH